MFALCVAFSAPTLFAQPDFLRGDCNQDGVIDIADAVNIWRIRFAGFPQPCIAACEADGNGSFNGLVDGLYLFYHVIEGGAPPPAPFPNCGPDPTPIPLACATFNCSPPPPPPPNPDYSLTLTDASGGAGVPAAVSVLLDSSQGEAIEGWSYGICHDVDSLELTSVTNGATSAALFDGDGPDLDTVFIDPGAGWTAGVIVAVLGGGFLDPGPDLQLHIATYDVLGSGTATVSFCETLGTPTVDVVMIVGVETVSPVTTDGTVTTVPTFIRGDSDGDGIFNALVDGLHLLTFGFLGGPTPPCLEAAEANGDATLNPLVDALYILLHGFSGGPPPPAPFPNCGVDPEPATSLGCDVSTCP